MKINMLDDKIEDMITHNATIIMSMLMGAKEELIKNTNELLQRLQEVGNKINNETIEMAVRTVITDMILYIMVQDIDEDKLWVMLDFYNTPEDE